MSTHKDLEQKRVSMPFDTVTDEGTFSGYASLFGKTDLGKDRVLQGAFRKSLRQRHKTGIRMLFQHDPSEPIGVWQEIREDSRGLFVKGRIAMASSKGKEVLALMRVGAVDGLSIGFKTRKSQTDRITGIRSIVEADLWEISIVTFPMLPQARVEQVKSSTRNLPTIREFERWLTRDAGLTRREAKTVIGKGFAHLTGKRDVATTNLAAMADRLRHATASYETNQRKEK